MRRPIRIAITTGDADGIGTEIAAKALAKLGPQPNVNFYLWRSPRCPAAHLRKIDREFKRITVSSWPEALKVQPDSNKELIDINSNLAPAIWVETAAQASDFGHLDGMATAPISKTSIQAAGFKDIGHTDILKRVSKTEDVFMAFIGDKFNVLLASGHLALEKAAGVVTSKLLEKAINSALELRELLPKKVSTKPIALLGLNPHAGETGLIGSEESKVHIPLVKKLNEQKLPVEGPLVPDAAFLPDNWKTYSVFVANYHDQGLIPFKMIHGQETGVHISMGLPFIRTSVDHGTAKNIFGKDKADPSSMRLAIEWAVRLAKKKEDGSSR